VLHVRYVVCPGLINMGFAVKLVTTGGEAIGLTAMIAVLVVLPLPLLATSV
jgi:hypothetical protein